MSNRVVSFLVLLVALVAGIVGTWWYFVANNATLIVHVSWNGGDFGTGAVTVQLEKAWQSMLATSCDTLCEIHDVPPFGYTLSVRKDGYRDYSEDISFERGATIERSVALNRNVALSEWHTTDPAKAILFAKARQSILSSTGAASYAIVGQYGSGTYFLDASDPPTRLMVRSGELDKPVMAFPPSPSAIAFAWNSEDGIGLFDTGKDRILFDAASLQTSYLAAPSGVIAVSRLPNDSLRFVLSEDGVQTLRSGESKPSAHPLYDDYLPLGSAGVLALVRSNSTAKKSLLNLKNEDGDLVILDSGSGKRDILMRSQNHLKFLGTEGGSYYTVDAENTKQSISNLPR